MILTAPRLPKSKKTALKESIIVPNCSVEFVDPQNAANSFITKYNVNLSVQGTTSRKYPVKNYTLTLLDDWKFFVKPDGGTQLDNFKNSNFKDFVDDYKTYLLEKNDGATPPDDSNYEYNSTDFEIFKDGVYNHVSEYALYKEQKGKKVINKSMPAKVFCLKADYASSENANNVELVKYYEECIK